MTNAHVLSVQLIFCWIILVTFLTSKVTKDNLQSAKQIVLIVMCFIKQSDRKSLNTLVFKFQKI